MSALKSDPLFLRSLIGAIPDMVWLKDPAGIFLMCNRATEAFLCRTESELVGKTDYDFFPKEEADIYRERDLLAASGDRPVTHQEWVVFRSDGRRALMETTKTALRDSEGRLVGVLGIARDITAAKTAETALAEKLALQEQLRNIAETVPGVIFCYEIRPDGNECVPYASRTLEEVCGIQPEELSANAQAFWDRVHPEDFPALRAQLVESAKSGSTYRAEFRLRHPRKGDVWLESRANPVGGPGGGMFWNGFIADITDRKRIEAALRRSEADLKESQRLTGIGNWVWDIATDSVELSDELQELVGLPLNAPPIRLEEAKRHLTPESAERLQQALERTKESGTPYELELECAQPNGESCWRLGRGEAVRDNEGRIVKLRGTNQDITERKRAETKLRAAHDELAAIQAHAPVIFLVIDRQLHIEKANETAVRFASRPESEMIGKRSGSALGCLNSLADPGGCGHGPDCGDCRLRQAIFETLRDGTRQEGIETWMPIDRGGEAEERCLLAFVSPLGAGESRRALVSILDITDRKRAEQQLHASEARFRKLIEDAPIAIATSRNGVMVYANPMYARMFGFEDPKALDNSLVADRYAPHCLDEVLDRTRRREQRLPVAREYEGIGRRADGSEFPMLVAAIEMQFAEGPTVCAFITDLTATREAEQERQRIEEQFRHAQKMESVGRLAGGVAHDFNNLLTVINGYSKLALGEMRRGDPLRSSLEEILKAGERAAGLTRQLLAFSRKQILEPRVLDLNRVVEDMQSLLTRLVGEDVTLDLVLSPDQPSVRADPHQLEQVIMNLAVNARDAMPGGGRLRIQTSLDGGAAASAILAVSDTGTGMDEATRQRIFEPFFTTKGPGEGTGLGLSTVQGIVEQSGGRIEVESQIGRGTTFRIHLPALPPAEAETARAEAPAKQFGNETILVVEDQAEVREVVKAALEAHGYRVIQAASPPEAFEIYSREAARIHLVLTDVVMPQGSGSELARQLKALRPDLKVLFMSGYVDGAATECMNRGWFIQKPFAPEELAAKVRSALRPSAPTARILVADDEAGVRSFLCAILEGEGYEVSTAADGKQAVRQALSANADLVITDLVMPEQEGIETIQKLRLRAPQLGIIAISGAFHGHFLKVAQFVGADAVMAKPIGAEQLLAKVAEILEQKRATSARP